MQFRPVSCVVDAGVRVPLAPLGSSPKKTRLYTYVRAGPLPPRKSSLFGKRCRNVTFELESLRQGHIPICVCPITPSVVMRLRQ